MAAYFATGFREAAAFSWDVASPVHRWQRLLAHKDREVARLNGLYRRLLDDRGGVLFGEHAQLADAHTIEVGGRQVTSDKILLTVGSWPLLPGTPGVRDHASTFNDVFQLA